MRKILPVLAAITILLSSCARTPTAEPSTTYTPVTAVNHYTLEPDEKAALSDDMIALYQGMVDAMLAGADTAPASSNADENDLLLDLLRQNPYYFFVSDAAVADGTVHFTYAYTDDERTQMLARMDARLLDIVNHDAREGDNELDIILKIYHAVTMLEYDRDRDGEEESVDDPLFTYPADEVYTILDTGKGVCYSFAYLFRLAMQQRGIDCFVVRGISGSEQTPHMWNIFAYDGAYFYCDPTWDRAREAYSRLKEFGKTEDERAADNVIGIDFSAEHDPAYGRVKCDDTRFGIFRGIVRFAPASSEHAFLVEDYKGEQKIFHTDTFRMT